MRWPTPVLHTQGETRQRVRFAWLPVEASDGQTYWLTRVLVTEMWRRGPTLGYYSPEPLHGQPVRYGSWYRCRVDPCSAPSLRLPKLDLPFPAPPEPPSQETGLRGAP